MFHCIEIKIPNMKLHVAYRDIYFLSGWHIFFLSEMQFLLNVIIVFNKMSNSLHMLYCEWSLQKCPNYRYRREWGRVRCVKGADQGGMRSCTVCGGSWPRGSEVVHGLWRELTEGGEIVHSVWRELTEGEWGLARCVEGVDQGGVRSFTVCGGSWPRLSEVVHGVWMELTEV